MTYVYDILLQFTDVNTYLNFFEWDNRKLLTHIKKIPLLKISSKQLIEIYQNKIQLNESSWNKLHGKSYQINKKRLYAFLVTDGMKVVALAFNQNYILEKRSEVLLEEEEEIIRLSDNLPFTKLDYQILNQTYYTRFLTKKEMMIKSYLQLEFTKSYKNEDINKLTYLYKEYFDCMESNLKKMYEQLLNSLNHVNKKHEKIYDLLQLVKK